MYLHSYSCRSSSRVGEEEGGGKMGHRRSTTLIKVRGVKYVSFIREKPKGQFLPKKSWQRYYIIISQDDKLLSQYGFKMNLCPPENIENFLEGGGSGTCPTELPMICVSRKLCPASQILPFSPLACPE